MSGGRAPAQKGYRLETSARLYFQGRGLECYRVPLSGAGREKGDLCLTTSWGQKLKIECKSRKELAKWIVEALGDHDAVIIKQDRGETYVLQRINTFADMCQ
jgi:Holliday junction resolvase